MNNTFKILNEGKIQNLKYTEYQMVPEYVKIWYDEMAVCEKINDAICRFDREFTCSREEYGIWEKWKNDTLAEDFYVWSHYKDPSKLSLTVKNKIAEKLGYIPFIPCVMFNISPAWKGQFGKDQLTDKLMIKNFSKVLNSYLTETISGEKRYTKYRYCLESGSEGNFLHAHIVAEINPKISKSVKTHIMKGNHSQQLKKYWDKTFQGHQGYLKGKFAIQRNLINTEEILIDKLKYLEENNKEVGHKNLTDLNILVNEGF